MTRLILSSLLLAGAALAAGKTPYGPCDKAQLAELKKALATATRETKTGLVSEALANACEAKLPSPVADALRAMHKTETHEHGEAMALVFREVGPFVKLGCPKWEKAFPPVERAAPGDKLRALYKECGLSKLKLMTEDEYISSPDLGAAYVAAPLHAWLTKNGMEAGAARQLIRDLLAIPEAPKPEPKTAAPKKK